jgi:hypothetical protein
LKWDVEEYREDPKKHIAKYRITVAQVEEVCFGRHIELSAHLGRHKLVGAVRKAYWRNGLLTVVVDLESDPEPDIYRVVSAHPANRKEADLYLRRIGAKL